MLEDASVRLVVTNAPDDGERVVEAVAEAGGLLITRLAGDAAAEVPSDVAYVMYTSGSTGVPKGCVIRHENVLSLMRAAESCYRFTPADTWTMFHSASFDFSVWEMWGALLRAVSSVADGQQSGPHPNRESFGASGDFTAGRGRNAGGAGHAGRDVGLGDGGRVGIPRPSRADPRALYPSPGGGRKGIPQRGLGSRGRCWRTLLRWPARQSGEVTRFRIELGEVEAAMRAFSRVAVAVCSVELSPSGNQVLVGYVLPQVDVSLDVAALRRHIVTGLPVHLRPQRILRLKRLPLSPNGKLDLAALPRCTEAD